VGSIVQRLCNKSVLLLLIEKFVAGFSLELVWRFPADLVRFLISCGAADV
jgi:hypothetical protein